ncbi:MAG: hypothetical protein ABIH18_00860 [Candidatus Omnitrophota bacterium]
MKSIFILFAAILLVFGYARARDNVIDIYLVSPQKYNAPMRKLPVISSSKEVSGIVLFRIDKKADQEEVKNNRYLVEYFIDDNLIYKTNGKNEIKPENPNFNLKLDTVKYSDGQHKLTVNFWDKNGPSSIGMENLLIKNNK